MLAKVISCAIVGLEGAIVEVQVDISPDSPSFTIVGLPDAAVQEATERVRATVRNLGYTFLMKRIVVNLAPADLKKAGPAYDLPIALSIPLSSEQVQAEVSQTTVLGELSLDGNLRHTNGVLPTAAVVYEKGFSTIIVPEARMRGYAPTPLYSLKPHNPRIPQHHIEALSSGNPHHAPALKMSQV